MDEPTDTDLDRQEVVIRLHEALADTAERPVERTASRWLGEAEAIAADLVDAPDTPDVIDERVMHIVSLLDNVDETGDQVANERLETATTLAEHLKRD